MKYIIAAIVLIVCICGFIYSHRNEGGGYGFPGVGCGSLVLLVIALLIWGGIYWW